MESRKEKYSKAIQSAFVEMEKQGISSSLHDDLQQTQQKMQEYKVLVPVIGLFSAGKTSVLNAFTGKDYLPVDLTPETAIATELHYAKDEKLVLVDKNNQVSSHPFSVLGNISTTDYLNGQAYLDSSVLSELPNIVLVDMPGIGSGVEAHNKALLNYIRQGSKYIMVIDVEDGTIKHDSVAFIKEILGYKLDIAVLVNKIDKKIPSEVDAIVANIKQILKSEFNQNIFVGKVSAHDNDLKDLQLILNQIQYDEYIKRFFSSQIIDTFEKSKTEIQLRINSLVLGTEELDSTIKNFSSQKELIKRKFETEKKGLNRTFSSNGTEEIIDEIRSALKSSSYSLATKLQNNSTEGFKSEVSEIIRPILMNKTSELVQNKADDYMQSLELDLDSVRAEIPNDLLESTIALATKATTPEGQAKIGALLDTNNPAFKSITGILAITTSIVAPWIEAIVFFLPEILKVFSGFLGGGNKQTEQTSQAEKIREKVEYEIIPSILSNLRPKIQESLEDAKSILFDTLEKNMKAEYERIENILKDQLAEKEKKQVDVDNQKKILLSYSEAWLKLINEVNIA